MLNHDLEQSQARIVNATIDFVEYVHSFYGKGGVYDMGASYEQICDATKILIQKEGINVCFDSIDRERVRDIMIEKYHLTDP